MARSGNVVLTVPKGTKTARFEPYRLQDSKCWGKDGDARLICTACHDPHKALKRNAEGYDGACLRCHPESKEEERVTKLPGKACPVGKSECVTCHMANVYIPEMHHSFHDHKIRILREAGTRH